MLCTGTMRVKTRIYVDGFNLYYGAVKATPFKWLDPVALSRLLLPPNYAIEKLRYFTARVSGKIDRKAPARQEAYLKALSTLPETELHFGNFLGKTKWRPLTNLPVADRPITIPQGAVTLPAGNLPVSRNGGNTLPVGRYREPSRRNRQRNAKPQRDAVIAESYTAEEKGSDVNLAVHLLNDAWEDRFDAAAVISNDTDLVTPIRLVVSERRKPVFIVCPGRWHVAPKLKEAASRVRHIRLAHLRSAQFPNPLPGTGISKPATW